MSPKLSSHLFRITAVATLLAGLAASRVQAQATTATAPSPPCSYSRCALGIVPAWNGLVVTRGAEHRREANLGFFWTASLDHLFADSDSARSYAQRAVKVRRVAAVLTNLGGIALGYAAVKAVANGELHRADRIVAASGAAMFGVSVPLQFAADGLLSRAIWWQNGVYAKR